VREVLIWFFLVSLLGLFPVVSLADHSFEFIPRISVSRVYDDNIYLYDANEKSDRLTTVSPGINMTASSLHRTLSIDYAPTWVWYDKYDENDTVRHSGNLSFAEDLSQQLRFELTDRYLKSEEPLEEVEEVEGIRRTRNPYWRNTGTASLRYQYGPENLVTLGYRHSLLENEDVTIDDGAIQNPYATVTYWSGVKNGLELNYQFTRADFSRDDAFVAGDDYRGHGAGIRYIHRFTPGTTVSSSYNFTNRNFEGLTEDYKIHEVAVGTEHSFSPDLSLSLQGGVFAQNNERSDDETGYIYDASLVKGFERGSFTIGGRGGWYEAYLQAERRGLTYYQSINSRVEYQFMQILNGYAGASFRQDSDTEDREWETFRGNCGLRLEILRWFSLSLDYSHAERDDDIDRDDYRVNRVMLFLTGSKPYRL